MARNYLRAHMHLEKSKNTFFGNNSILQRRSFYPQRIVTGDKISSRFDERKYAFFEKINSSISKIEPLIWVTEVFEKIHSSFPGTYEPLKNA